MAYKTLPELTAEFVKSILDYDPETGFFTWRHRADRPQKWNTLHAGKRAGTVSPSGYVKIQIGQTVSSKTGKNVHAHYAAHVLAWLITYGEWLPNGVDHRFGVRGDNRISELRRATSSDNGCNKAMQRNNKSGHVGVWFVKQCQKWEAKISKNRQIRWRGQFHTFEEAVAARQAKIEEFHGEFTATNTERARYYHTRDH